MFFIEKKEKHESQPGNWTHNLHITLLLFFKLFFICVSEAIALSIATLNMLGPADCTQ